MNRDLIDLACRMIATPSVTTQGTRALAELLAAEVLPTTDLSWRIEPGSEPSQVNLVAAKDLGRDAPILLNSHLDTVPPGDVTLWTECGEDPFRPTLREGNLYGLGSADAKLDWLCKALALGRWKGRRFSRGALFAGTFGEERGLQGARALLLHLPQRPAAAWVGEPTELRIVTRHKGMLVVTVRASDPDPANDPPGPRTRLRVLGRSAHSSTPDLGESAVLRALDVARALHLRILSIRGGDVPNKVPAVCEMEVAGEIRSLPERVEAVAIDSPAPVLSPSLSAFLFDLTSEQQRIVALATARDPSFVPPGLTSNLGRLCAEGNRLEATLDFRCVPGESADTIIAALERFAGQQHKHRHIEVAVDVERNNPPLHVPADAAVVSASLAALATMGRPLDLGAKSGCTEAGLYARAGIPAVVFGPGRSAGNIHAPNEHVAVAELEAAVEFYSTIIAEHCL
jgi:acetylornithine deacetylase/succinyl-diaminopimelate desuccinylase-like protein